MMTQRKMKAQPPLSDAYLHGMPAKRRKVIRSVPTLTCKHHFLLVCSRCLCLQTGLSGGSLLSLSDAVSQAARTAGVKPITSAEQLQDDLETQELKEAYSEQVSTFPNEENRWQQVCSSALKALCFMLMGSIKCFQHSSLAHMICKLITNYN